MYEILKRKNLLYIEDDLLVLGNISTILKNYFNVVHTSLNAEDGCDIFRNNNIDLIIVDIELPGMSGIEFIKQIRDLNKETPIIILSAYTKTDYLLESIDLKVEQYIVKPFTSKKLHSLLNKFNNIFAPHRLLELTNEINIDCNNEILLLGEETFNLTSREFDFLKVMAKNKIVTYAEIDIIWDGFNPTPDAIRSFIKQLRKKLPKGTLTNRQNIGYYV